MIFSEKLWKAFEFYFLKQKFNGVVYMGKIGNNRYLLVCRAGDNSLHKSWIEPKEFKNFDLLIDYYGDEPDFYRNDGDYFYQNKGPRWPGHYNLIESLGGFFFQYDAVCFIADDIDTNASTISNMFDLFSAYDLWLAQPALTKDSYFSHWITLENSSYILRYTNFVEIMVPIFSPYALKVCWETFRKVESGWGLDFLWPYLLDRPKNKIAVLDSTPVKHTRPIKAGNLYKNLNTSPNEELEKILKDYQLKYEFNEYGGIQKLH